MKKTYRILALLFALLMVASCFIGCKKDEQGEQSAATTTVSSGEETEDPYASSLPLMDWQEAIFMILGRESTDPTFEIAREELPDDVVGKAVYERNDALSQKYNFVVQETLVADPAAEMEIRYGASEDLYDAVIYTPTTAAKHAQENYFLDLKTTEYLDVTHPSWNQYANQQLTISGKLYFTVSDFLLSDKERYFVMHYNRDMAREAGKGYLEDMIANNTWNYDEFNTLVTDFSFDGDGDGMKGGLNDNYGVAAESIGTYSLFIYGGGFRLSNNVDGVITMAGAGSDIVNILTKSADFALNYDKVYYPDRFHNQFGGNAYGTEGDLFYAQKALFLSAFLQSLDKLQENVTFERAYMPYPKLDTNQDKYYTMINDLGSSVITIPYTVADAAKSGYMLQAITEASTTTTYPAYFQQKCKLQGSVDQRAADTLDLIFENVVFDVAYIYDFGKLRNYLVLELPKHGAYQRYNTVYGQRLPTAEDKIAEITAAYADAA